jgi:hypothetical protein
VDLGNMIEVIQEIDGGYRSFKIYSEIEIITPTHIQNILFWVALFEKLLIAKWGL